MRSAKEIPVEGLPSLASGNSIYGPSLTAAFTGATPTQQFNLYGGITSSRTFYGTVAESSSDGSCEGSFAFLATRK